MYLKLEILKIVSFVRAQFNLIQNYHNLSLFSCVDGINFIALL